MLPIVFHPEAEQDVLNAADHYKAIREDLKIGFQRDLQKLLDRIQSNPLMYAANRKNRRVGMCDVYPYSVTYEVFSDRIWVAIVKHHRQRPGYGRSRLS